jgi:hypothetical protein
MIEERIFDPNAPYTVMLRARWKALIHTRFGFPRKGCRIWRVYSHLGFKTRAVFCECGEEFR